MKKVIRLSETHLKTIIEKVIKEQESNWWAEYGFDDEKSFLKNYEKVDNYALELIFDIEDEFRRQLQYFMENIDLDSIIERHQEIFREEYPQYVNEDGEFFNEHIDSLINAKTNIDSEILLDKLMDQGGGNMFDMIFYDNN
jgi:hypothetical protein